MSAYYNEIEPHAVEWLRNLMAAGLIPPGDIDQRDIREVAPDDIKNYTQCHFFAGVSGWTLALGWAGWSDNDAVWTGSCPCPPFSAAGQQFVCPRCEATSPVPCPRRTGVFICWFCEHAWQADERHLWPEFRRLIAECRPPVVFGEQVAGPDGLVWLAGVRASLEICGYAFGSGDLPAASVGAPNIRQRLWWVADADGGNACAKRIQRGGEHGFEPAYCRNAVGMGQPDGTGRNTRRQTAEALGYGDSSFPTGGVGLWDTYDIVACADGKARRVESGTFPLAHGIPGRVGKLRAWGNAINPVVAAEFIQAYRETIR